MTFNPDEAPKIPKTLWPAIREVDFSASDYEASLETIKSAGGVPTTVGAVSLATQIRRFNFPRAVDFGGERYCAAQREPLWCWAEGERIFEDLGRTLLSPQQVQALVLEQ
jgi:hypothetical protein